MGYALVKFEELRVSDLSTEKALELKAKGKEKVSGTVFIAYSYETAEYKQKNAEAKAAREAEESLLLAEHTKNASERTYTFPGSIVHFSCGYLTPLLSSNV